MREGGGAKHVHDAAGREQDCERHVGEHPTADNWHLRRPPTSTRHAPRWRRQAHGADLIGRPGCRPPVRPRRTALRRRGAHGRASRRDALIDLGHDYLSERERRRRIGDLPETLAGEEAAEGDATLAQLLLPQLEGGRPLRHVSDDALPR
jgi:hypothetical protein